MVTQRQRNVYGTFQEYAPSSIGYHNFGLKRVNGINGRTISYSLNDLINGQFGNPNERLIEYRIGNQRFPIFTVSDFARFQELINPSDKETNEYTCTSNICGLLAERMSWATTYAWLERLSENGRIVDQEYEENHFLENSDRYILQVKNSPRVQLFRKSSQNPTGYIPIKELDGFFVYRQGKEQYVIVQETKVRGLSIGIDNLVENLFNPLQTMYPNSKLIYIVYSDLDSIYFGGHSTERRRKNSNRINEKPKRIFKTLLENGVGTIFFSHKEGIQSFNEMTAHIIRHAELLRKKAIDLKATYSPDMLRVWHGNTPIIILTNEGEGHWKESPVSR